MKPFGGIVSKLMTDHLKASGAGSHDLPYKYMNQDYESLKQECLKRGSLFEDPYFPAITSSLGYNKFGPESNTIKGVEWKRPSEIVDKPQFIVEGATRKDICQGQSADCWLLCAIACLTMNEHLLHRVVPHGQNFQDDYVGIFHFQIWQYSEWVDVVIDDRLPVKDEKLMFVHSAEGSEFWSPLLEKAYAKLNSSYEAINWGFFNEAFVNFTGGLGEYYNLRNNPPGLDIMREALKRGSMMSCHITTPAKDPKPFEEDVKANQLVILHVYAVTGLEQVNYKGSKMDLIRLRNPWGKSEWSGAWSDNSPEWNELDPSERNKLQLKMEDGEFWMPFTEFERLFTILEICNLTPDALKNPGLGKWHTAMYEGSWRRGSTAGGCKDNPETFWMNPKFKITLLKEDDDPNDDKLGCNLLVAVMQKNFRREYKNEVKNYNKGFAIYKVPDEGLQSMRKEFFQTHEPCAQKYEERYEVSDRICLPPGEYVIIPSTWTPNLTADFLLRIFTETQSELIDLDKEVSVDLPDEVTLTEEDVKEAFKKKFQETSGKATLTEKEVEDAFKKEFQELAGEDMGFGVSELKTALDKEITKNKELKMDGFSMGSCCQMVNLMDNDGSGMLGIVEYHILWNKIQKWLTVFRQYDLDNSGTMNSYELRLALETAGFKLNNQLIQVLVTRYSDNDLGINFDNFVCCLVKLEAMFRFFKAMDQKGTDTVTMNMKEWLTLTMCG